MPPSPPAPPTRPHLCPCLPQLLWPGGCALALRGRWSPELHRCYDAPFRQRVFCLLTAWRTRPQCALSWLPRDVLYVLVRALSVHYIHAVDPAREDEALALRFRRTAARAALRKSAADGKAEVGG